MKKLIIAAALLSAFTITAARAEDEGKSCDVPKDQWKTEEQMKAKAKDLGLDVRQVKVENGCYEVYAIDAKGNKVEQIYDPATLEQVGAEGQE